MSPEASPDPNVVTWDLTPAPHLGRVAYAARSTCPHGEVETFIFSRPDILRAAAPQLATAHAAQTGCACPMGPIAVGGVPFPFDEEAPDHVV